MNISHPAIRRYTDEDHDTLLDIWLAASRIGHPFLGEEELRRQSHLVGSVYLPKAENWVAVANGRPIGFIGLLGAFIGGLFVYPDICRKGIGTALVEHATSLKGPLDVEAYAANKAAVSFYRSLDFAETGRRSHDDEGRPFELIRMRRGGRRIGKPMRKAQAIPTTE